MPQREPARHQTAGEPPSSKVSMRLDQQGRWVVAQPKVETTPATEAAERPPMADDTRNPFERLSGNAG